MGCITGSAGGVIRDVLLNNEPVIFHKEIYAMACVLGTVFGVECYREFRGDLFDQVPRREISHLITNPKRN